MNTFNMSQRVFVFTEDTKGWGFIRGVARKDGNISYFVETDSTAPVMLKAKAEHCFPTIEDFHRYIFSNDNRDN